MNCLENHPPVRVGIAGCGYWGPNLARNFDALPGAELVAVCDLDAARCEHMKNRYPLIHSYDSLDRMLSGTEIDAVAVASPVRTLSLIHI